MIMQQGHSICCYYCLSIGLVSTITLTVQIFDKEHKSSIEEVVYIKLNDSHPCDHQYVVNQYIKNVEEQLSLHNIKSHPVLLKFLKEAMEQNLEELFFWLGAYAFDRDISEEEKKDLLFAKLVLADYYANCVKPNIFININERTPFVEYIVPIFKYFSATYRSIAFQW